MTGGTEIGTEAEGLQEYKLGTIKTSDLYLIVIATKTILTISPALITAQITTLSH